MPGPGTYNENEKLFNNSPKITIKRKYKAISFDSDGIGPGAYNPKIDIMDNSRKVSIKSSSKRIMSEAKTYEDIPGPGQYDLYKNKMNNGVKYHITRFPKSKRLEFKANPSPSTAQYNLPSTVCYVPKYAMH